ncbi:MAG: hypothetical protein PUG79_06610 [Mediterraneibacter faecis]|nr:hypothetical protein [Mediterraneibacter faecis]
MKTYKKAVVEAVNAPSGSYAAGCPVNQNGFTSYCRNCERTK